MDQAPTPDQRPLTKEISEVEAAAELLSRFPRTSACLLWSCFLKHGSFPYLDSAAESKKYKVCHQQFVKVGLHDALLAENIVQGSAVVLDIGT